MCMIVTVENFEENFDEYMERVESGEIIKITHNDKVVAVVPYDEYNKCVELIRLYTEHDEGS